MCFGISKRERARLAKQPQPQIQTNNRYYYRPTPYYKQSSGRSRWNTDYGGAADGIAQLVQLGHHGHSHCDGGGGHGGGCGGDGGGGGGC